LSAVVASIVPHTAGLHIGMAARVPPVAAKRGDVP